MFMTIKIHPNGGWVDRYVQYFKCICFVKQLAPAIVKWDCGINDATKTGLTADDDVLVGAVGTVADIITQGTTGHTLTCGTLELISTGTRRRNWRQKTSQSHALVAILDSKSAEKNTTLGLAIVII